MKLYVGNLPFAATADDLKKLFSQAGEVAEAVVISDRATGRSKGFGFVTMSSDEEAKKAITMFNDQDFQGRKLRVNEARPLQPRPEFKTQEEN